MGHPNTRKLADMQAATGEAAAEGEVQGADRWRTALAGSASLWAAPDRHVMEPGWCSSFSGTNYVDNNIVFCWGRDGTTLFDKALEAVQRNSAPALVFVAGPALGSVQSLADAGWVCVGEQPAMVLFLDGVDWTPDAAVRALRPDELDEAWDIAGDAFRIPASHAGVILPHTEDPRVHLWGLHEDGALHAVMVSFRSGDTAVVWSLSTRRAEQGRGYGRRLTCSALLAERDAGVGHALLLSSPEGLALYNGLGFRLVDHWQMWSRRRWVLRRA